MRASQKNNWYDVFQKVFFLFLRNLGTQKSHICYRICMVMLHLCSNNLLIIATNQILTPMTSHIIIWGHLIFRVMAICTDIDNWGPTIFPIIHLPKTMFNAIHLIIPFVTSIAVWRLTPFFSWNKRSFLF